MLTAPELVQRGDELFNKRGILLTHWQDIAENFYPQRADFTILRTVGEEIAGHLYSSYPLIVHRELSSAIAAMLRKRDEEWFQMTVEEDEHLTRDGKAWLEEMTRRQRRAMYDRRSMFIRATTEGDADFTAFGQCVISREIDWSKERPHLLYRCWHLRDVAWREGYDGRVNEIHIRWKPRIEELQELAKRGFVLHQKVASQAGKDAMATVNCRRIMLPTELCHGTGKLHPWMMLYIDVDNELLMKTETLWAHGITLPRWQTVSGSQYAYSPAAVAGLPDARLLQAMTLTLLEAGEMAVRPPLVATADVMREDLQWYPGGVTYVDAEYDERLGEAVRPISQDKSGIPYGMEAANDQRSMLATAFYLNKLNLPPTDHEMTATETRERIEEYIRAALPLFEPMEVEYNGALCEDTFEDLFRAGLFGPPHEVPKELQGRDVRFRFSSPLHEAIERRKANSFLESKQLIREAIELDPNALYEVDIRTALSDALDGIRSPQLWRRDAKEQDQLIAHAEQREEAAAEAMIAKDAGQAAEHMANAQAQQ
jgi:hypothetical protein